MFESDDPDELAAALRSLPSMKLDVSDATTAAIRTASELAAAGKLDEAVAAYEQLLDEVATSDYETAAVAHMYAIIVEDPQEKLAINEKALRAAEACAGEFPPQLFASLYANVGYSKRELGDLVDARRWYEKAVAAADALDDGDDYGRMVRAGIASQLRLLDDNVGGTSEATGGSPSG